jgi:hypothetical protein
MTIMQTVHTDLVGNLFYRQGGTWVPVSGHNSGGPTSELHLVHLADYSPAGSLCIHILGKFVLLLDLATEVESLGSLYLDDTASPIAFYTRDERGAFTAYSF